VHHVIERLMQGVSGERGVPLFKGRNVTKFWRLKKRSLRCSDRLTQITQWRCVT